MTFVIFYQLETCQEGGYPENEYQGKGSLGIHWRLEISIGDCLAHIGWGKL